MKLSLNLGMKQRMTMTPRLQQAIKLLHLSAAELEEEIEQELASNPVLERREYPKPTAEYALDSLPEAEATLRDYLYWQLNLNHFTELEQRIAVNIIDAINDDGYLQIGLDEIASNFSGQDIAQITAVLRRIQEFDPLGVAARDLQECMLLQTEDPLCKHMIKDHMGLLASKKYNQIKTIFKLNEQQLKEVIDKITKLNPRPGSIISQNSRIEYIIPDVIVSKFNRKWIVSLNPEVNTNLEINSEYGSHMREQLAAAKWLLHSLQTRNETLLKVSNWIVKYQSEFLEHGAEMMRPLKLRDIADDLVLNESTISRICSSKYLHCPRGTFELKYFFSSSVSNDCSSTAIKAIIKKLINSESANKPLSDEEIRKHMDEQGITIARRTIAKYREALGILPSQVRKSGV